MRSVNRGGFSRDRRAGGYVYPGAPAVRIRRRVGQEEPYDDHGEAAGEDRQTATGCLLVGGNNAVQALADLCSVLVGGSGSQTEARRRGENGGDLRERGVGLPPAEVLADYDVIEEYATAAMDNLQAVIDALALAKQAAEEARQEIRTS